MAPNFSPLMREAGRIVVAAGKLVEQASLKPRRIRHKGRVDLVTETDTLVERFLMEELGSLLPKAAFLAEESAQASTIPFEPCWIIDPVDGTTNFAHGLPVHAISVAFWNQGQVAGGIVHAALMGETFMAEKGRGAYLNNKPIQVSGTLLCEEALVATGFPYSIRDDVDVVLARLHKALVACQGIRRCGAASLDMAWLACGRFDGYFEAGIKPWDVAAGWLLVTEAGGTVTDFTGAPYVLGDTIVAANPHIHQELLNIVA